MNKIASAQTGNSSLIASMCLPVVMALALVALILFAGACSDDSTDTSGLFPTQPLPEARNWLFTVQGTDANNIYAAGAKGTLFHFDGNEFNKWTLVPSGTDKAITSIWDSGDGTLFATGHGGVILRNTGGSWSNMTSGTTADLFGIGRMKGDIYACGFKGTLLKLSGSTWGAPPTLSWIIDESGAPSDTLIMNEDLASLVTVNSYFIGGAYYKSNFIGIPDGMNGTRGGVFEVADHSIFPEPTPETGNAYTVLPDWILRPLSGEQIVEAEWMLSSTSEPDPLKLNLNYLGSSEGWLFQLSAPKGSLVWTKFYPAVTQKPGAGIQAIWLDDQGNVYMVTDEGSIVYQTSDYIFDQKGYRDILYSAPVSLTGIWGSSPNDFFVVGYMDDMLLRCNHTPRIDPDDPDSGEFSFEMIPVEFPADKAMDQGPAVDKFGRPLY